MAVDEPALVAQWIEHRPPEPGAEVRFLSRAFCHSLPGPVATIAACLSRRRRQAWLTPFPHRWKPAPAATGGFLAPDFPGAARTAASPRRVGSRMYLSKRSRHGIGASGEIAMRVVVVGAGYVG